jgi:flagellar motility protein MotE (MotC chaperone)
MPRSRAKVTHTKLVSFSDVRILTGILGIKNAIVPTPKINVDDNDDDGDDPAHIPGRRVAAFNRRSDQPSQGSNLGQGKSRTVGVTTTKAMLETAANGVPSSRLASGSTSQRSTNSAAKDDADDLLQKAKDELRFVRRGWKWCWDLSNARAKEIESLKKELNEVKTELDDQTERNSALEASLQGKDEKIQDLREEMGRLQTLLLQNGLQF